MARTSPAPNVPPIPGMCPGVAVLGGGGGGGGAGGKGSKKGKGKKGAGKKKGKKNASGNKKKGGEGKGDPICPITGRVFTEILDFAFPGPAALRWTRHYSSRASDHASDLGFGWRHAFDWRLQVSKKLLVVIDDHGAEQEFDRPSAGTTVTGFGWTIATDGSGFCLSRDESEQRFFYFGAPDKSGVCLLLAVEDANHNRLTLHRAASGALQGLTDSAGRPYVVESDSHDRLVAIRVARNEQHTEWLEVVRYEYDSLGNLCSARDAGGFVAHFRYDNHLLVQHESASGLSYFWRYDGSGADAYGIETWGEYVGRVDPALEPPIAPAPTDGVDTRKVKGIHYARLTYDKPAFYSEVEDGLGGLTRYFGDDCGRVVKTVLPNGGVIDVVFDQETGEIVEERNVLGEVRQNALDEEGAPTEWADGSGRGCVQFYDDGDEITYNEHRDAFTRRRYDRRGNETFVQHADGTVEECQYDERGLVVQTVNRLGSRTRYHHDAMGNCVCIEHPNGDVEVSEFDYLGRRTAHTSGSGARTEWGWDERNEIIWKRHADGSEIHVERDARRNPLRMTEAGKVTRYQWGGLDWLCRQELPDGTTTELRYDTEGHLVYLKNGRGQEFRQRFDHAGRAVEVVTFEGAVFRAAYDVADRPLYREGPAGRDTYTHDEAGRLIAAETPDGTIEVDYGFDGSTAVRNGKVDVQQAFDSLGRVIQDRQGAVETNIGWRAGEVHRIVSGVGVPLELAYDGAGSVSEVVAGPLRLSLDKPNGRDLVTRLGDHLVLRRRFGPTGLLVMQAVARFDPNRDPGLAATNADPSLVVWISYEHDQNQTLRRVADSRGVLVEYDVDLADRVVECREWRDGSVTHEERIGYDRAGTVRLPGVQFDAAGRPIACGEDSFRYDDAGRLVARETPNGAWLYSWDAADNLVRVEAPDHVVEMEYDGRGRRMRKRVLRQGELTRSVTYVWTNEVVLHEHDDLSGATRTYLRRKTSWEPLGHVDLLDGVPRATYYLTDPNGALRMAVDERGDIVWDPRQTTFGACVSAGSTTAIDVRFANQFWDEDVGLAYTRFRWYDPSVGLFVTPDPALLDGSLNPRDYAPNPRKHIDPTGLRHPGVTNNPQPAANGHPTRPGHPGGVNGLTASYLSQPGHWATNGTQAIPGHVPCPASHLHKSSNFPAATQNAVNAAGNAYGCHSCGRRNSGYPDGHWTCDHQPPKSQYKGRNPAAGSVRLYPHCKWCSRRQMRQIRGMSNSARRTNATNVLARSRANQQANPWLP